MVNIYSPSEIQGIALSGKILAEVLAALKKEAREGISLRNLDALAHKLIKEKGGEPAFLGYKPDPESRPFGASICASVNNVVVHGFPSDCVLKDGDVLKIDAGVKYKGFFSDSAITVAIGKISKEAKSLILATEEALGKAIKEAKPGKTLGDIGFAIQGVAQKNKLGVIRELTGHGIGFDLHEDPTILNFGKKNGGMKLEEGMVLAIEPMFSLGSSGVIQLSDESWATDDGSLSAHFEHTVAVTAKGPKILTK
jgi:methionyl aminopeptidase